MNQTKIKQVSKKKRLGSNRVKERRITKKGIENILFGIGVSSENRMGKFFSIDYKLTGETYWWGLREAFTDSDNLYLLKDVIREAFLIPEPRKFALMTFEERNFLKSLPERITIYRGMTEEELLSGDFGISWSLKKEGAEYFAFTYPRNHATNHLKKVVHEITVLKKDVIAFFNERNESEIIYIQNAEDYTPHFYVPI